MYYLNFGSFKPKYVLYYNFSTFLRKNHKNGSTTKMRSAKSMVL